MSRTLSYIVSHLLWLVSGALAAFEMLVGLRVLSGFFGLVSGNRWLHSTLDRFAVLILGLMSLAFVILCEYYYRKGVERGALWRRFGLVTGAQVLMLACLTGGIYLLGTAY